MTSLRVPFGDLKRENAALRAELEAAFSRVLTSGWFILGQEVAAFEAEFAAFTGNAYCVGVSSGADALYLALAALDIGPGDEVITIANACMYQVAAVLQTGARPVLVDIDPITQNMDPQLLEAAISPKTKAILPVHLFGRLANMPAIMTIAERHNLPVIEDAAQAHGAWQEDAQGQARQAGGWGTISCFSFYPSKNLGALGDAGALTTNDPAIAERLRSLRMYGWQGKYNTVFQGGRNARIDELQAALLRVKLPHVAPGNAARRERTGWYAELLADLPITLPADEPGHIYHLYVIEADNRDALRQSLVSAGIGCDVHYPTPTHLQPAYQQLGYGPGSLPVTESLAKRILSLPLFPELSREEIEAVAAAVRAGVSA